MKRGMSGNLSFPWEFLSFLCSYCMYKNYINKTRIPKEKKDNWRTKGGLEGLPNLEELRGGAQPPPPSGILASKKSKKEIPSFKWRNKKNISVLGDGYLFCETEVIFMSLGLVHYEIDICHCIGRWWMWCIFWLCWFDLSFFNSLCAV